MRRRSVLYGSLAIAATAVLVACGDDPLPTKPSSLSPSPFVGIQVMGPDTVASGQSVQFVANIRQADGTTKSATNLPSVIWRSSNDAVALVSQSGLVTGRPSALGSAVITAEFADRASTRGAREVVVQPAGSYRIAGTVHESDEPTIPIGGARVEVLPGSRSTMTDSTGQYLLFGVPAQSTIRITALGFETLEQPLDLNANVTRNFGLNVDGPRTAINGPYTISVDVVHSCSLEPALLHRTYDAVLTTTGTAVDVALTEPRFRLDPSGNGNHFRGHLLGGVVTFTLDYYSSGYFYDFQYPSVVERLGDNTFLVVQGMVTTTGSAAGLTGTLNGEISHWDSRFLNPAPFPDSGYLGSCGSNNFQFRVTPR